MLTLNFGSEKLKKEVKYRRIYNLVRKVSYLLIFFSLILATALSAARIVIQNNFNRVVNETTQVTNYGKKYTDQLQKINSNLQSVALVQNNHISWIKFFKALSDIKPANISFTSVKIDSLTNRLVLSGTSDSREELLLLKQHMESSPLFADILFPIQNILEKSNITFEISAKISIPEIEKYASAN